MQSIDETFNGRETKIQVGETLQIALDENRTTGFRWKVRSAGEPACRLTEDRFEPPGKLPGGAGVHHWRFQATQPGDGTIELDYVRPWDEDAAPARSFTLLVHVLQ